MSSAKRIADYLLQNDNYHIIVHKNPDGDCLGSSKALCLALRSYGKNAKVILPNEVSPRLLFMWNEELETGDFPCECVVCTDVASIGQMGCLYEECFKDAPKSVCIDHHGTNEGYADINYIDATSAATGEMILEIIEHMDHAKPPLAIEDVLKKDGTVKKGKLACTLEELHALIDLAHSIAVNLTENIRSGMIDAAPVCDKSNIMHCKFCKFAGVCRRDSANHPLERPLEDINFEDLVQKAQKNSQNPETIQK